VLKHTELDDKIAREITALEAHKLELQVLCFFYLLQSIMKFTAFTHQRYVSELRKAAVYDEICEYQNQGLEKIRGVCEGEQFPPDA
jgi:hypothetical protein